MWGLIKKNYNYFFNPNYKVSQNFYFISYIDDNNEQLRHLLPLWLTCVPCIFFKVPSKVLTSMRAFFFFFLFIFEVIVIKTTSFWFYLKLNIKNPTHLFLIQPPSSFHGNVQNSCVKGLYIVSQATFEIIKESSILSFRNSRSILKLEFERLALRVFGD